MQPAAIIEKGVPAVFAAVGFSLLGWWVQSYRQTPDLPERPLGIEVVQNTPTPQPPTAARPDASLNNSAADLSSAAKQGIATALPLATQQNHYKSATTKPTPVEATTPRLTAAAPLLPGLWPAFRGPQHNAIAPENAPLASQWSSTTPRMLWTQTLGEGYAGPAVQKGRVYLLDYDSNTRADTLRCFSLADGSELWRQSYPVDVRRNHGMSRTVPSIENGTVITLGPKCHLMATDADSGTVKWKHDLVQEYGTTVPEWYAGQCPLIDGNRAIVGTGGKALVVAFDLSTGREIWRTPNPRNWNMTHSSLLPLVTAGEKILIYCGSGGIAGISAKNGALLWDSTDWVVSTATVPTPVDAGDGKFLLTGGYNAGAMMAQITKAGGKWHFKTLWRASAQTLGSDQQTPIIYRRHIYAVIPGGQLACVDLNGKQKWTSGQQHRYGLGPYLIAAGKILALSDRGTLTMAEATHSAFRPLGQVQLLDGREAWGPLALAGSRLLARDATRLVCVDLAP